jgi:glyoxylase-like metal-dependent hydrolase (beta-lactamase superfamily II)
VRTYEVAPEIWRLRLPLPWPGIPAVNAFALHDLDGGLTLVDCGGGGHPSYHLALEEALTRIGHRVEDVRLVVLTHYHSDHAGAIKWLIDRSGCEVAGHPDFAHFTDAGERPAELEALRRRRAVAEGVPTAALGDVSSAAEETEGIDAPIHPTRPLCDGDTVTSTAGTWHVVETPGHCPSHICLHEPDRGMIMVADLLAREFSPWFDYGYSPDPVQETFASFDRVEALGAQRLVLPGHGRALEDLPAVIAAYRQGIAGRLEEVRAAVAAGAVTAYEVTLALFGADLPVHDVAFRLTEICCYLRHHRLAGRIVRETAADGRFRYVLGSS